MKPQPSPLVASALVGLALATITALCFRDALTAGFIFIDDSHFVTRNPHVRGGLTLASVRWALTGVHAANWMPLTWISHQLDWSLFGDNPRGHHAVAVGLHAVTAAMLAHALFRLTGRRGPAVAVAAIYALHPLRVESVAWIAERKDVLCAFFFVATLWAWSRWRRERRWPNRLVVVVCVAAGLASKSMMVTTPAVLVLVDVWCDGRRLDWRRLIDALPELALAAGTAVIMVTIQDGTSMHAIEPLTTRLANAVVACWRYVELTFWPVGLSVFHPGLRGGHPDVVVITSAVGLTSITALALAAWARGQRAPLIGWLWFLGMLVPVSGIVPIGAHAFAERYTNLPHIGLFIAVVFGLDDAIGRRWLAAKAVAGVALAVVLCVRTGAVVQTWHSSRTLAAAGLRTEPSNPTLLPVVGLAFVEEGAFGPGIERFEHAIAAQRVFLTTFGPEVNVTRLGLAWLEAGRLDVAVDTFIDALTIKPGSALAHRGLSIALFRRGEVGAGLAEARLAVRDGPDEVENHRNLMSLLVGAALWDEALAVVQAAPLHVRRDLAAMEVRMSFLVDGCRAALGVAEARLSADPLLLRAFFEERALAAACVEPPRGASMLADIGASPTTRAGILAALIVALHESRSDDVSDLRQRYRAARPQQGLGDDVIAATAGGPLALEQVIASIDRGQR